MGSTDQKEASHLLGLQGKHQYSDQRFNRIRAHQRSRKNEKTGQRGIEGERKQSTDFKEATCCSSVIDQRAAWRKNSLCEESAQGNWDPREGQRPFQPNPNGSGTAPPR